MNAQEIIASGILEMYCTGLTSAAENAEVAQWAKQYPEVAAELEAIQAGLETYARANAVEPDPSVKEKVLAGINAALQAPVVPIPVTAKKEGTLVRRIPAYWKYAAAASILLLLGSMYVNYSLYTKYQEASSGLEVAQAELKNQKEMMTEMGDAMKIMGDMHATPMAVRSVDSTSDMGARMYWMKSTNEVYIDPTHLPDAPAGKQYEFWAIVDGKPVNAGVITGVVNGKKVYLQKMKSFGNVQAFAISMEAEGSAKTKPDKVMAIVNI